MASPPAPDPFDAFDHSGGGGSGGMKVVVGVLAGVVVLVAMALVGLVVAFGGDDDGEDAAATTEVTESDAEAAEDAGDETNDDLPADDLEADPDDDGLPNDEDPDDDGDGVPDAEDPDPVDPDVPGDGGESGEPGDDGDDGAGGDEEDPGDGGEAPSLDLLRNDPGPAIDAFLAEVGDGAYATEVVLYTDYAFATVRDADRPGKVRRHLWRDDAVELGDAEDPFPGTPLDDVQFRLTRPNWDALPALVADAPRRAGRPNGEVSHVIVTSDLPFNDRFIFRIYVPDSPQGYVRASFDGRPLDA